MGYVVGPEHLSANYNPSSPGEMRVVESAR